MTKPSEVVLIAFLVLIASTYISNSNNKNSIFETKKALD